MKPYFETDGNKLYQGHVLDVLRELPDESVHCCVTSPPYWGLRDYGVSGQIGLEKTPEEYIEKMVQVFREVKRVLRKDGTLWLNMGDSYAGGGRAGRGEYKNKHINMGKHQHMSTYTDPSPIPHGMKPKDLIGIPWAVSFALRFDGWYLRSDIIWNKPNPMPESVTDRPTKSHEYIFLLTKSPRYYYDREAIREEPRPGNNGTIRAIARDRPGPVDIGNGATIQERKYDTIKGPNKRTVWTVATHPFPEAHFATFPPKLIEPCILAGTSEKGCCPECGAPWVRVVEKSPIEMPETTLTAWQRGKGSHDKIPKGNYKGKHSKTEPYAAGQRILKNVKAARDAGGKHDNPFQKAKTIGWKPGCDCRGLGMADHAQNYTIPCTVLDPFAGSSTTGIVAHKYGRRFILIELSEEYAEMSKQRLINETRQMKMF